MRKIASARDIPHLKVYINGLRAMGFFSEQPLHEKMLTRMVFLTMSITILQIHVNMICIL